MIRPSFEVLQLTPASNVLVNQNVGFLGNRYLQKGEFSAKNCDRLFLVDILGAETFAGTKFRDFRVFSEFFVTVSAKA